MFASSLQSHYTRLLMLATAPFVLGTMMGCVHSLVAALLLIAVQLLPSLTRLRLVASS